MKWTIPEKVISQGRKYADEGRVTTVTQDLEQEVWHAEVIGSEIYQVELDGTPREKDTCTCVYWKDKGYCKHTVAVELALRDKGLNRVLKQNKKLKTTYKAPSMAKMFTESFAKIQDKETAKTLKKKQPLEIEFIVENIEVSQYHPEKSVLGVSYKLGYHGSRKYVVRNVGDFLLAYSNQENYKINDKHQFELQRINFSEEAKLILDESLAILKGNKMIVSNGIPTKGTVKQRELLLPSTVSKYFIKLLIKTEQLQLKVDGKILRRIEFSKGKLPIQFEVTPKNKGFILRVKNRVKVYWEMYQWCYSGVTIYELDNEQEEIFATLLQLLKRVEASEIYYEAEHVANLFSYVLPSLAKIGTLQVDDSLQTEMIQVPLNTKLLLYEKKGQLTVSVDFIYSDVVFSTDEKRSTHTDKANLVIRNQVQESKINQVLEHYGYTERAKGYSKKLPDKVELYELFSQEIPHLRKMAEVEIDASLSSLYLDSVQYQPSVEIKEDGSWLDIHFDVSNIAESEVNDVLISLVNRASFYQLENGQILSLDSEVFQQTSEALAKLRGQFHYQDGKVTIPKYRGLEVKSAFQNIENTSFSQEFSSMVEELTQIETLDYPIPSNLQAELREYQIQGFRWLKMLSHYHFGGILADDMGLGKTVQTIAYLLSEKDDGCEIPSLIVAPASLIYNWQVECEKFAPSLKTVVINGSKMERKAFIENYQEYDVLITSYASLRQDEELYRGKKLHCLVLDEAQMVKNSTTKTFQALKDVKTAHRFALSGTPIENNLEELWSIFYMLMPGFFPSKAKYKELSTEEIARMIQPFVLRREKKQVLKDLPDKIEANLYSVLTEEQKKVYLAYLKKIQETVSGMNQTEFKKNRISILAGLTRLRQICCDPRLFIEDYEGDSGKLEQLKELVLASKENGRRLLIFSQFTSMLSIIQKELEKLDIESFYLRGSTKPKDRVKMVDEFNDGEKDVFLISLKAGGTGLNLTGADTVILYDLWWNPAVEEQAAGRAHRMGQKKVVEVWRLIAEGTIEEKMNVLQQDKRELFDKVINSDEEHRLAQLTEEDIRAILSVGMEE